MILYVFSGVASNFFSLGEVTSEVREHQDSISKSLISMNHVTSEIGSPSINLTLSNDGQEKTWQFSSYDVFVTYDGAASGRSTEQLSYSGDCSGGVPAGGNWCIESISKDMIDPGILNPTEEAKLRLAVNENLAKVNAIVSINTAEGVTTQAVSPYCGPNCYQIIWTVASDEGGTGFNNIQAGNPSEFEDNNDRDRTMIDLTDMREWRLVIKVENNNGSPACIMGAQYSLDGGNIWMGLDNGLANTISTNTISCNTQGPVSITAWVPLHINAQTDSRLRVVGDDVADNDPAFGTVQVQFRH